MMRWVFCHTSHVARHTSHVTRHTPQVRRQKTEYTEYFAQEQGMGKRFAARHAGCAAHASDPPGVSGDKSKTPEMVAKFYNLVTDFYE